MILSKFDQYSSMYAPTGNVNRVDPNERDDPDAEIDVISLDEWGHEYGYATPPTITIPPQPVNGLNDATYLSQLAKAAYDFMMYYQREHFRCMQRILDTIPGRTFPRTMASPGWFYPQNRANFVHGGYIEYQHPDAYRHPQVPREELLDPFFAHPTSPGRTLEGHILPPSRQDYNYNWISELEDSATNEYIVSYTIAHTTTSLPCEHEPAAIPPSLLYHKGAPIDVHGFPMTHHYDLDTDGYVPHGPNPAFTIINEDNPTPRIPSHIVLQRWPTGPDHQITETNPLYQFAQPNVEINEGALLAKPEILCFNPAFFDTYSLLPNLIATAFRNTPHRKSNFLNVDSPYHKDPPNINGQFIALHHNCYPATSVDEVYATDPTSTSTVRERFHAVSNPLWDDMEDLDRMKTIDNSFIDCYTDEDRILLWTSMVPFLLMYEILFCSVCCCRVPYFYFSMDQRHTKDTLRACRHCNRNRMVKFSAIHLMLGVFGYFSGTRRCMMRSIHYSKWHFGPNGIGTHMSQLF
eukprot:scaffold355797_cov71-Attheya_sp.AAC.2